MTEPFSFVDRRGRTPSGLQVGSLTQEMNRLRQAGYTLPKSPTGARAEAAQAKAAVTNRTLTSEMGAVRRRREAGRQVTGANVLMALPKVRQPLSSLQDKNIPYNVGDPNELAEIRRWARLFYSTHDLVPLLIDIYSKFPLVGLEFDCLAVETPVITSDGVFPIGELAGGVHRVLTRGGKWVEAPFKNFGVKPLMKVTLKRNGRRREFHATPNHGWFVELKRYESGARWERVLTEDLRPGQKLMPAYGRNVIGQTTPSPFGVAHGMTFGDGSRNTSGGGCHLDLHGEKDAHMLPFFAGCTTYRDYEATSYRGEWVRVNHLPRYFKDRPALTESTSYLYGWLSGYFAADGTVSKKGEAFIDSAREGDINHARAVCQVLGIKTSDPYVIKSATSFTDGAKRTSYRLRLAGESLTEQFFHIPEHRDRWEQFRHRRTQENWTVVSVEETDRVEETYCAVVPETECFALDGNILTSNSKDPLIKDFYSKMFLDELNYLEFLPDAVGREYFVSGEVTTLAHFSEALGVWSSEEVLNPDMLRVTKSLFVQRERVQLLVKDMVDSLRTGPGGTVNPDESPSEKKQRAYEYEQLVKFYPEIIAAAAQDDGLDISDALLARIVNKTEPWAMRGTPFLLRSFRTLMREESLNSAQDAIADRLYSPFILARLGAPDLGDGAGAWIPDQGELDAVRDDMQAALAADFRLLVGHFGLDVQNVFGREAVPRFDADYDRIDRKLMQAWGIGPALIEGGSAAGGAYASSALNREFVTQMMQGFQASVKRLILKRAEVIAEAQGHVDYQKKGHLRIPIYRDVVEVDEETGEERIVRVPKLLLPDVKFACVAPGTQVLTPTGQRNVEDVQPGDEVISWDGTGYVVDTALHTGIEHRDSLVEVVTAAGRTVRCTDDHPFWTGRGWVHARDLTGEDAVRTSAGHLSARVESDDDLDLLRFLGLLVGDGNYSTTHVALSVSDPAVDEFAQSVAGRLGVTARRKADARTDKVWYRTFVRPSPWKGKNLRNPLHTLLREQGMWGQDGHAKRVPPIVWAAGEKGRAAFLSGYLDADGHATRISGMKLSSVNRALLDDCQVLFESLGIRAQVRSYAYTYPSQKAPDRPQPLHVLTVSHNRNFQLLREHLSPLIASKSDALDDMARPATRGAKPHQPVEWDKILSVTPAGAGNIVTLGITGTHTHVTAGLVSHNTLNLRDEAQERQFLQALKGMGVPISDQTLAVNISFEPRVELQRVAEETVEKLVADAEAMAEAQRRLDAAGLPYPPQLSEWLDATLKLRQEKAGTEMAELQRDMAEAQAQAMSPAGQMGLLPGQGGGPPPAGAGGQPGPGGNPPGADSPGGPAQAPGPEQAQRGPQEVPRNRTRPPESDEQRAGAPRAAKKTPQKGIRRLSKFETGPSTVGALPKLGEEATQRLVDRLAAIHAHTPPKNPKVSDLVEDPHFWTATNMQQHEAAVRADWPEIDNGGAKETQKLLREAVEQYEEIYGVEADWQ